MNPMNDPIRPAAAADRGFSDHDLTTWALGELDALDPATIAAIEAAVAHDDATRAAVASARDLADALAATFAPDRAAAPDLRLSDDQRAAIRAAAAPDARAASALPHASRAAARDAAPSRRGALRRGVSHAVRTAWSTVRGWSLGWQLGTLASAAIVLVFVVLPTVSWLGAWGRHTAEGAREWMEAAAPSDRHAAPAADAVADTAPPDAERARAAGAPAAAMPTALWSVIAPTPAPDAAPGSASAPVPPPADAVRKIIKDATLSLEVESVPLALGRIEAVAAQSGGYVVETRTDLGRAPGGWATIKIGVPVDQFEAALQRVRDAGTTVLGEHTSGVDASQEYVDLQSQVANLEATQARIREFLAQATTVEESLRVNAQLAEIEGQLGQVKGRMRFLADRAAYSTITVELHVPPPAGTPTPTATPTPAPGWSAVEESRAAAGLLASILRVLATFAIWFAVVVLPLAAPVAVVWWAVRGRRSAAHG